MDEAVTCPCAMPENINIDETSGNSLSNPLGDQHLISPQITNFLLSNVWDDHRGLSPVSEAR